jgi:hypothetical protein
MADYGALLERMIAEAQDPDQRRQFLYELARLTLRRQLQLTSPAPSIKETREHLAALDAAIVAREEAADRADALGRPFPPPQESDVGTADCSRHRPPDGPGEPATGTGQIGVFPDGGPIGAFAVEPVAYAARPERTSRADGSTARRRWTELATAAVLPVALYAALIHWTGPSPPPPPAATAVVTAAAESRGLDARRSAEPAPSLASAPPSNPLPTLYGVYAHRDGQFIELEQVATVPVDPRVKAIQQITTPSRTILPDSGFTFLVFRRDIATSAPERMPIRIAARLARLLTFDASGKAVNAPPPEDRWVIRDTGFDFRVRPVRDNLEMVWVQPDETSAPLPAGRYVLMINATPYDFTVEGPVSAPAHCLESVATARGPTL